MSTWTRVADRLPDENVDVLVFTPRQFHSPIGLGYFHEGLWYWDCDMRCNPTHWMELPDTPEES